MQDSGNVNRIRDLAASAEEEILQNLGTDAGFGKKTIYGYVQGLEGYSRRNTGGIRENAKFFYAIRELTATREAGFAKI